MENLLITGGLGHIGSKITNDLKNYNITIVDNLSTQRYCSLFNNRNIEFLEKDFIDLDLEFLNKFDIVLHLAAITDAASSFSNENETWNTNVTKTKKFIDIIEKTSIKLFVFPSSTSVYGVSEVLVDENNEDFLNPQSPYAKSKIEVEKYLSTKSLNYVVLRLGTIFGVSRGMRFHTAINKFCYQAAFKQPLTIWKENYEQKRPYLGLDDFIIAFNIISKNKNYWNQIYNVLTENYTTKEIVEIIKSIANDIKINFVDTPLLNQYNYEVSQNKIIQLGYKPTNDLKNEMVKTLKLLGI